jgi:hypothetical protein
LSTTTRSLTQKTNQLNFQRRLCQLMMLRFPTSFFLDFAPTYVVQTPLPVPLGAIPAAKGERWIMNM